MTERYETQVFTSLNKARAAADGRPYVQLEVGNETLFIVGNFTAGNEIALLQDGVGWGVSFMDEDCLGFTSVGAIAKNVNGLAVERGRFVTAPKVEPAWEGVPRCKVEGHQTYPINSCPKCRGAGSPLPRVFFDFGP